MRNENAAGQWNFPYSPRGKLSIQTKAVVADAVVVLIFGAETSAIGGDNEGAPKIRSYKITTNHCDRKPKKPLCVLLDTPTRTGLSILSQKKKTV